MEEQQSINTLSVEADGSGSITPTFLASGSADTSLPVSCASSNGAADSLVVTLNSQVKKDGEPSEISTAAKRKYTKKSGDKKQPVPPKVAKPVEEVKEVAKIVRDEELGNKEESKTPPAEKTKAISKESGNSGNSQQHAYNIYKDLQRDERPPIRMASAALDKYFGWNRRFK